MFFYSEKFRIIAKPRVLGNKLKYSVYVGGKKKSKYPFIVTIYGGGTHLSRMSGKYIKSQLLPFGFLSILLIVTGTHTLTKRFLNNPQRLLQLWIIRTFDFFFFLVFIYFIFLFIILYTKKKKKDIPTLYRWVFLVPRRKQWWWLYWILK